MSRRQAVSRVIVVLAHPGDAALCQLGMALGQCTVIGLGAEEISGALATALEGGAHEAVRIWDPSLEEADYLAVAHVLAKAVRAALPRRGGDAWTVLVSERGTGALGPALAERLGVAHLGLVTEVDRQGARVVACSVDAAGPRRYQAPARSLLCCVPGARASRAQATGARGGASEVKTWTLDDVGLSPAEITHRHRFRARPLEPTVRVPLQGAPSRDFRDVADLARRLRADGLVANAGESGSRPTESG